MKAQQRRVIYFGIGLAIGFGLFDWFFAREFNPVKLILCAILGSVIYRFLLMRQGRYSDKEE